MPHKTFHKFILNVPGIYNLIELTCQLQNAKNDAERAVKDSPVKCHSLQYVSFMVLSIPGNAEV